MTSDLTGKFDYSNLKQTLKENGVKTFDIAAALKQIAKENNIDLSELQNLDGTKDVSVDSSIFAQYAPSLQGADEAEADEATLLPYTAKALDDTDEAPEIYNDDDYEVADYDDFYNFEGTAPKEETKEGLDFKGFKTQYQDSFVATNTIADEGKKEEALKNFFAKLDTNSDELLQQSELSGSYFASLFGHQKYTDTEINSSDEEDFLGNGMMDMDMSNDSFNPNA